MNLRFAKAASIVTLALTLGRFAQGQAYRETYPIPDGSDFSGLCVNVNLADATEAQFQQIVDGGYKFVRIGFTWDGIEKGLGVYDWTTTDRVMARARAKGLRVFALLAYSNALYTTTGAPNTPTSRDGFSRFAAAAAARYAHQGVIWEIYNEPNLGWWRNPNPVDYALLVNQASQAIRAVSSDEWIVGLSTEAIRSDNRAFITTAIDNGILENLDGIAPHPYTQQGPEVGIPKWDETRTLIEAKRPANRPIALLAGEVGYSRTWSGITPEIQATYMVRTILLDMVQGVGFTNVYNYQDSESPDADWHNTSGITSRVGNVPYPVYYAIQRMTTALKGYKLTKRLKLASDADYCLLFSKADDATACKLVVWTSDAPHAVKVPSSVCAFSSLALTSGAGGSVNATAAGLSIPAAGEAAVYACQGANPLLNLAASWAKLPSALTLSTRADAIAQIWSIIVSPAWTTAPAGTTLKIEDVPKAVPGYVRPSYTATLSNLSSLTLNSAAVQTVFNSLGALQDSSNKPRTLTFTIFLPDGTSAVQTAAVSRKQPLTIFPTTPSNWALTLRVENPTGVAFTGKVVANSGLLSLPQPISFIAGETYKMVTFPTFTSAIIGSSVTYDLFDSGANAVDPGSPVIDSSPHTVYRTPNFVASSGYSIKLSGNATIGGSATMSLGAANWLFLTGAATADIDYSFVAGGSKCVLMNVPTDVANTSFAKAPVSIGMWVNGDGKGNFIRSQFVDTSNQTFQVTFGAVDWTGWKWVSIPIAGNLGQYWGGANDGVVHGAMRCLYPFIFDSNQLGTSGRVSVQGITIAGQK